MLSSLARGSKPPAPMARPASIRRSCSSDDLARVSRVPLRDVRPAHAAVGVGQAGDQSAAGIRDDFPTSSGSQSPPRSGRVAACGGGDCDVQRLTPVGSGWQYRARPLTAAPGSVSMFGSHASPTKTGEGTMAGGWAEPVPDAELKRDAELAAGAEAEADDEAGAEADDDGRPAVVGSCGESGGLGWAEVASGVSGLAARETAAAGGPPSSSPHPVAPTSATASSTTAAASDVTRPPRQADGRSPAIQLRL